MSTRATIAVRRDDGMFDAIYLHFDGYPTHAGEILMQHHSDPASAANLVAGGELRCLDRETGRPQHYADGARPAVLPTQEALVEFARNCGARFVYVFDDGAWSCREL